MLKSNFNIRLGRDLVVMYKGNRKFESHNLKQDQVFVYLVFKNKHLF